MARGAAMEEIRAMEFRPGGNACAWRGDVDGFYNSRGTANDRSRSKRQSE